MSFEERYLMIKIVFVDFDGTLYSHYSNQIPSSTIEAFRQLQKNNVLVYLCTGRGYYELTEFDLSKFHMDGMILTNGQLAFDADNNLIFDKPIKGELKEKLIKIFKEKKVPLYYLTQRDVVLNFVNQKIIDVQAQVSSYVPAVKEYNNEEFYMASAFVDTKEQINEILALQDIAEITYWHEGAYDIVPQGVSKATGIDEVIKKYNIDISETMAFGDGENDIEMLKHVQIGVAMGNSLDTVKLAADYVTDDIDNNGIFNALKHFKLI